MYKSFLMERQVMQDTDMTYEERFGALLLMQWVDWQTGIKVFNGNKHLNNWLNFVGFQGGMTADELHHVLATLVAQEHVVMDGNHVKFIVWDDEDE